MKIFFDGNIFSQQKIGGISRVGFELIKELSKKKDVEQIFYRGFYIDKYPFKKEWFKKYYGIKKPDFFKGRFLNFFNNLGMEAAYKNNASNDLIYHSLYYRIPKHPKGPVIVHCHDMIQELFNGSKKAINFKKKSFDKADLIIAISESTKKDLCKIYPDINPEKVVVIPLGISSIFLEESNNSAKNSDKPYMLYVGARNYQYKNFDLLLDVFIEKKYFLDFDLVLVGGEKELTLQQKEKIRKTAREGDWLLQKFCSDEELAELYSEAEVFIYPSLYEGFGIPPLEAMARRCPVLASNASSIPEVVGDAGLLFNPKDRGDLANKLETILKDKNLVADLVKKGKERAKQFTWSSAADKIYKEYKKIT